MKNAILIIFNILMLAASGFTQDDDLSGKVEKLEKGALQIMGAEDAKLWQKRLLFIRVRANPGEEE